MVEIRLAREEYHSAIVKLWHRGWHDAHAHLVPPEVLAFRTPEHFALWLEQCADAFYVAANGSDVLGFVSVKGAEVVKLYVDGESRGTGTARALLAHAEGLLAEQGFIEAELYCTAGNVRAQNFYARQGWSLSRTFQDALWMPDDVPERHSVETHRYRKNLAKPAANVVRGKDGIGHVALPAEKHIHGPEAARQFAPNGAVAEAYARRYLLYSEINSAMVPLWERIAGQQART